MAERYSLGEVSLRPSVKSCASFWGRAPQVFPVRDPPAGRSLLLEPSAIGEPLSEGELGARWERFFPASSVLRVRRFSACWACAADLIATALLAVSPSLVACCARCIHCCEVESRGCGVCSGAGCCAASTGVLLCSWSADAIAASSSA